MSNEQSNIEDEVANLLARQFYLHFHKYKKSTLVLPHS